jgi:type VI secretion system secreted protein VgrG
VISGIKSNSTPGGGGYNEISLNDTKGTELINIFTLNTISRRRSSTTNAWTSAVIARNMWVGMRR